MRILITGAGGPSAISVWKSLNDAHELHMADMDPCAAGLYLVPPAQRLLVPRGDAPELVETLLAICIERNIELLLPTVDSELAPVAKAKATFAEHGIATALPSVAALKLCRDKHQLLTQLSAHVPVPDSVILTEETAANASNFPLFAKSRLRAGSRGLALIKSPQDLALLPKDGSYLLQECLPGEEYSVDVYITAAGNVLAAVPRERMKTDSGIAVTARTIHLPEAITTAINAAQAAGITYIANVQLKRSKDGILKLLEINPRFPGTLPLTAAAGIDIPKLMVNEITGVPLPQSTLPFRETAVVRYWTEQYFDPNEMMHPCRP